MASASRTDVHTCRKPWTLDSNEASEREGVRTFFACGVAAISMQTWGTHSFGKAVKRLGHKVAEELRTKSPEDQAGGNVLDMYVNACLVGLVDLDGASPPSLGESA